MTASWPADKVERWPVAKLVPNARNARTHSDQLTAAALTDEPPPIEDAHSATRIVHESGRPANNGHATTP